MSDTPTTAPQISGPDYVRLIGIGAAIGVPGAVVALVFLELVHVIEQWLWHTLPSAMGRPRRRGGSSWGSLLSAGCWCGRRAPGFLATAATSR